MDDWEDFRRAYVVGGGSARSAASYLTYLRAVERTSGSVRQRCDTLGRNDFFDWIARQPDAALGGIRYARHARSALKKYAAFHFAGMRMSGDDAAAPPPSSAHDPTPYVSDEDLRLLLEEAQSLGARYYHLTGKPLGVTGEVAELEAANRLGLDLCAARMAAYDAVCRQSGRTVQIKGRAVDVADRYRGMCPAIRCDPAVDEVALVILDRRTLRALEIWAASMSVVADRVAGLLSDRRRANGTLAITQFRSIAKRVWQTD